MSAVEGARKEPHKKIPIPVISCCNIKSREDDMFFSNSNNNRNPLNKESQNGMCPELPPASSWIIHWQCCIQILPPSNQTKPEKLPSTSHREEEIGHYTCQWQLR